MDSLRSIDLFDLAPVGMALLDDELRCVRCNANLAESYGSSPDEVCGKTVRELIPDLADEVEPIYRKVLETDLPVHDIRAERTSKSGRRRSWLQNVVPLPPTEDGRRFLMLSVQEITLVDAAERALREVETRLHTYQQISADGFTLMRALRNEKGEVYDFEWEFVNPAAERMANVGQMVGNAMGTVMPGSHEHPLLFARYRRLVEMGESDVAEVYYDQTHTKGWFRNHATALGADRIAVSWRDITARKQAEEELKLVSGEYRHRIKNLLTIVSSLIAHAGRTSQDAASLAETIQRQIQALAAAQDQIGGTALVPVDLSELVMRTVRPFGETALEVTGGPVVPLPQRHAIPIVLALHELATNALKHGGLSSRGGTAKLSWSQHGNTVALRWSERVQLNHPSLPKGVASQGFGSRLFSMVERSLPNGKFILDWRDEGLLATLTFDLDDDSG